MPRVRQSGAVRQQVKAAANARWLNSLYIREEDLAIINFISSTGQYANVGGIPMWKALVAEGVVTGHSWQSIKDRFRRQILKRIGEYGLPREEEQRFALSLPNPNGRRGGWGRKPNPRAIGN